MGTEPRWKRYRTPEESLAARTIQDGDCLIWTGSQTGPYGQIAVNRKPVLVHRFAWEMTYGPIPEGKEIDHECHRPLCVNPDHLRIATRMQNRWNMKGAYKNSKTGVLGVHEHKNGYRAVVRCRGVFHRKYFPGKTEESLTAAGEWARQKRAELFGEYAGA